jgi:hypothetical protein
MQMMGLLMKQNQIWITGNQTKETYPLEMIDKIKTNIFK